MAGMTTTTIGCPHCSQELFRVGQEAPEVFAKSSGPELDHDEKGYFVTCQHCTRRVDIDVISTEGSGARLRVRR